MIHIINVILCKFDLQRKSETEIWFFRITQAEMVQFPRYDADKVTDSETLKDFPGQPGCEMASMDKNNSTYQPL